MGMHMLFGDETNVTSSDGDFFIYGGLATTPEGMIKAHGLVADVRSKYGFKPIDSFKFHTRSRPDGMEIGHWTAAKTELLKRAAEIEDLDLITYVVLHDLARNVSAEDKMRYALNAVLGHFDLRYLSRHNSYGIVSVDRVDSLGYDYLEERFTKPLELPGGRSIMLTRTLHLSQTCDGASHMSSLVDIALGAFRYCVNTATGSGRDDLALAMFAPIAKLMWGVPESGPKGNLRRIGGYGFLKYPKTVKAAVYQDRYKSLEGALQTYANADATEEPE
ncbi:hypothetical protein O9K63_14265 [Janibacter cremeus]|uniref:hypothetical protein n=1 Tax=Janibacter cremeus TaxID=1285192 RepID=UPI0023F7F041|nr:hypothetical protein [Janibacter cremeus]WEV77741.1 hypothetical protein O9K63_14265 [Janibacter cremeus]